jgi:hypothetical protein
MIVETNSFLNSIPFIEYLLREFLIVWGCSSSIICIVGDFKEAGDQKKENTKSRKLLDE